MGRMFSRYLILIFVLFSCACAKSVPPPAVIEPMNEPKAVLAITLQGDVEQKDETTFVATGPEIICDAVVIRDTEITPVANLVEWKTEPPGGTFSHGGRGVFYLADEKSEVRIYAVYEGDSSPMLTLRYQ